MTSSRLTRRLDRLLHPHSPSSLSERESDLEAPVSPLSPGLHRIGLLTKVVLPDDGLHPIIISHLTERAEEALAATVRASSIVARRNTLIGPF